MHGEAVWFLDGSAGQEPLQLLALLGRHGLDLRNPVDDHMYVLVDDGPARREASLEYIVAEWSSSRRLDTQLWMNPAADVLVAVGAGGGCINFDLGGWWLDEAEKLVEILLRCARQVVGTRALVVDQQLPDRNEEWFAYMSAAVTPMPYVPDLILLSPSDSDASMIMNEQSFLRHAGTRLEKAAGLSG